MSVQFRNGEQRLPAKSVAGLAMALSERLSAGELAKKLKPGRIEQFKSGQQYFDEKDVWPLLRVAYETGLFHLIPSNDLPAVSYNLWSDVNLERSPLGVEQTIPHVKLARQPVTIGGLPVDFPLGLPASIITANASYLGYYARLGFDILTYKTVRSRAHPANFYPQWVFLEDAKKQLVPPTPNGKPLTPYTGRQKYFPADIAESSMANSFGVPSHDPEWWLEDLRIARTFVQKGRQVLIVSVMATVPDGNLHKIIDDFVRTATYAKSGGADIIELNYSCPNTNERAGEIFNYPNDAMEISKAVKTAVGIPLFVKIGYMPKDQLRNFVIANVDHIDGIVGINTISAPVNDPFGNQMFPGRSTAGISGWAIQRAAHEVAVNLVEMRKDLGREDSLNLLGLGGVMTKEDFNARLATGVNAVEICTAAFLNPMLGLQIRTADMDIDVSTRAILPGDPMELATSRSFSMGATKKQLSESGEIDMSDQSDQLPSSNLLDGVDLVSLFEVFKRRARTITPSEYFNDLRRYNEEYARRHPTNVPPWPVPENVE